MDVDVHMGLLEQKPSPTSWQSLLPFGVLIVNAFLFNILRGCGIRCGLPAPIQWILLEFLAAIELIADCAELDVVLDVHGIVVFGLTLFILCFWWSQVWAGAEGSPCDPLECCLLERHSYVDNVCKIGGQLLAAKMAFKYVMVIWSYKLSPEHAKFFGSRCDSPLQVPLVWGMIIEGVTTFTSRWVALESTSLTSDSVAAFINSFMTVVLVLASMETTGGFFNPILAAGLKYGCGAQTEHLLVYWTASLVGGLLARSLHRSYSLAHLGSKKTD